ncbi:hypothetical protein SUGI_0900500 [Cryptomeria japonica]|nr:hypothetical protein SUGI_0900500 [Cryptomeria japonica]
MKNSRIRNKNLKPDSIMTDARKMKSKREEIVTDHILQIAQYAAAIKLDQTVTERAQTIYRDLSEKTVVRKVKMCALHLACIYIAAKQLHRMKTMEELAASVKDFQIVSKADIYRAMRYIKKYTPEATFATNLSVGSCSSADEEKEIDKFVGSESVRAYLAHLSQLLKSSNLVDCEMINCAEKMAAEAAQNLGVCTTRAGPHTQAATLLWICSHFVEKKEAVDVNLVAQHSVGKYTIQASSYLGWMPPSLTLKWKFCVSLSGF